MLSIFLLCLLYFLEKTLYNCLNDSTGRDLVLLAFAVIYGSGESAHDLPPGLGTRCCKFNVNTSTTRLHRLAASPGSQIARLHGFPGPKVDF